MCRFSHLLSNIPIEILHKILFYLEASDIIELLRASTYIQLILRGSYVIISDRIDDVTLEVAQEICLNEAALQDVQFISSFRGTALLEIYEVERVLPSIIFFLETVSEFASCKITISTPECLLFDATSYYLPLYEQSRLRPVLKSLIFTGLARDFVFNNVPFINVSFVRISKASILQLVNCGRILGSNEDHKVRFGNNLIGYEITAGTAFEDVLNTIELPFSVVLEHYPSQLTIENLKSNELQELIFRHCDIFSIKDCNLPKLGQMEISEHSKIGEIIRLDAVNLREMVLSIEQSPLLLDTVILPNLKRLSIKCPSISNDCKNLFCPKLKDIHIEVENVPLDFSTFQKAFSAKSDSWIKLSLKSNAGSIIIPRNLKYQNLKVLKWNSPSSLEGLEFIKTPKLQELSIITLPNENEISSSENQQIIREPLNNNTVGHNSHPSVPQMFPILLNSKSITKLSVQSHVKYISNFELSPFKNLTVLELKEWRQKTYRHLNIPTLAKLEITFSDLCTSAIKFRNCKFENLRSFKVKGTQTRAEPINVIQFDVYMPKLKVLEISALAIQGCFSIRNYFKLEEFFAPIVKKLFIPDSASIRVLDLSNSKNGTVVYFGELPNIEKLFLPRYAMNRLRDDLGIDYEGTVLPSSRLKRVIFGKMIIVSIDVLSNEEIHDETRSDSTGHRNRWQLRQSL